MYTYEQRMKAVQTCTESRFIENYVIETLGKSRRVFRTFFSEISTHGVKISNLAEHTMSPFLNRCLKIQC